MDKLRGNPGRKAPENGARTIGRRPSAPPSDARLARLESNPSPPGAFVDTGADVFDLPKRRRTQAVDQRLARRLTRRRLDNAQLAHGAKLAAVVEARRRRAAITTATLERGC